jgi:hypothetical protein
MPRSTVPGIRAPRVSQEIIPPFNPGLFFIEAATLPPRDWAQYYSGQIAARVDHDIYSGQIAEQSFLQAQAAPRDRAVRQEGQPQTFREPSRRRLQAYPNFICRDLNSRLHASPIRTEQESEFWMRVYSGVAQYPGTTVVHRDWYITPSSMLDEDFTTLSGILGVSVEAWMRANLRPAPECRSAHYVRNEIEPLPLPG